MSQRRETEPGASRRPTGERPAVHPVLGFHFDADTRTEARGRSRKSPEPTSILEALSRWLDQEL
ncbi:MAG: hypothetical protein M3Y59_18185 [Myxococcota bacterium]|nr:hypothetical protein [Myxococcota bacterium]